MSYWVQTRWGSSEDEPSEKRMKEILSELDVDDPEHPDCWLTHESGWTLAIYQSGLASYENTDDGESKARYLLDIAQERALSLWSALARGDFAMLEDQPWQPGHSPPLIPQQRKALEQESAKATLFVDRQFYDSLGPERPETPCRHEGRNRGSVRFSVLCRIHHFENIQRRPCPFTD